MENDLLYSTFISFNISITLIIMIAACLCWKKKIPKHEFMGLEGMVKLKYSEDNIDIPIATGTINTDEHNNSLNASIQSTGDIGGDSKRASNNNAPHRSLPDIPVAVTINDNISDLYATVNEKIHQKPQGRSPTLSIKKEISLSQHSSISQADDVSSPYARVKQSTHNYDEVRSTEHPYAKLNAPNSKNNTTINIPILQIDNTTDQDHNQQQQQSLQNCSRRSVVSANSVDTVQELIPAASAIAGMISASQELPYMTPPIVQQPHFSGDSQDSSKGYTSISVREPLVNILAQTKQQQQHPPRLSKHGIDSHYATVSDDSDEMYAAIADPNNHGDIYTSGSDTYAQIQPTNNSIIVSVEINSTENSRAVDNLDIENHLDRANKNSTCNATPNFSVPHQQPQAQPPVPGLRAYDVHSRQASDCSMGNLSSPKPEKRQANSPLPPTPKSNNISSLNLASTVSISSGRNSVASIIEVRENSSTDNIIDNNSTDDSSPKKKNTSSPSKDIEGMYAKVIKSSKFLNTSSQNNSPILNRRQFSNGLPDTQISEFDRKDKKRLRSNSFNKHNENKLIENRMSDGGYSHIMQNIVPLNTGEEYQLYSRQLFPPTSLEQCPISLEPGYESLPDTPPNFNDPGYETLLKPDNNIENKNPNSDYDPNYEVLQPLRSKYGGNTLGDDGYAKVIEKKRSNKFTSDDTDNNDDYDDEDNIDGYSKVKNRTNAKNVTGYSSIVELSVVVPENNQQDNLQKNNKNHDYASISEALKPTTVIINNNDNNQDYNNDDGDGNNDEIKSSNKNLNNNDEKHSEIYSTIVPKKEQSLNLSELKII